MSDTPLTFVALGFALGLVVGSFLNVVIHRLPREESVVHPRSRCPSCRNPIAAWDNIPVLSWLILGGKCRHCEQRISMRYPLIELATGVIFAVIVGVHGATPMTILWLGFAAALVACAGIDFDERWIPDELSVGGLLLGLIAVPAVRFIEGQAYGDALLTSALGAGIGGGVLWVVGFAHARVSVWMGRSFEHWPGESEELPRPSSLDYWVWFPGLGFGDVKLMAMVGAFLGPLAVFGVVFLAAGIGLVMGLLALLSRGGLGTPFGFGPAISMAAIVASVVPIVPGSLI